MTKPLVINLFCGLIAVALAGWVWADSGTIARPNPVLTPGTVIAGMTADDVCRPGYARHARAERIPEAWHDAKLAVMRAYGLNGERLSAYELDHLVPICAGGSNDWRNLWPQPIDQARRKDDDEIAMCRAVCEGRLPLSDAQRYFIEGDWAGGR